MFKVGILAIAITTSAVQIGSQPDNCAPRERRMNAIRYARTINTVEAAAFNRDRRYAPLANLQVSGLSSDYQVQFITDGASYAFAIKDQTDACHGAVFSDQAGVIYTGTPLQ